MVDDEKIIDMTMQRSDKLMKEDLKNWRKAPAKDPFLVVLSGVEKGKKILLISPVTTLGRAVQCNIQIKDRRASRSHANLNREDNSFTIFDQNSSNGTWVNNSRITGSKELKNGDLIIIGSTELLLTIPEQGK